MKPRVAQSGSRSTAQTGSVVSGYTLVLALSALRSVLMQLQCSQANSAHASIDTGCNIV